MSSGLLAPACTFGDRPVTTGPLSSDAVADIVCEPKYTTKFASAMQRVTPLTHYFRAGDWQFLGEYGEVVACEPEVHATIELL